MGHSALLLDLRKRIVDQAAMMNQPTFSSFSQVSVIFLLILAVFRLDRVSDFGNNIKQSVWLSFHPRGAFLSIKRMVLVRV